MVKNLLAMWETWVWYLGREDTLEKGKATHSSILAWRIPWTEEPGRLQSVGSQRVGHDWATNIPLRRLSGHTEVASGAIGNLLGVVTTGNTWRDTAQETRQLLGTNVTQLTKHLPESEGSHGSEWAWAWNLWLWFVTSEIHTHSLPGPEKTEG